MRRTLPYILVLTLALAGATDALAQAVATGGVTAGGGASSAGSRVRGWITGGPAGPAAAGSRVDAGLLALLQPPATVQLVPAATPAPAGAPAPISVAAAVDPTATLEIHYRLGGEGPTAYRAPVTMTANGDGTFTGQVPAGDVGVRGLEFYVVAIQNGLRATVPAADPQNSPLVRRVALAAQALPALPDAQYRMVSFPFEVNPATVASVFEDDLGAQNERQWRLERWSPAAGTYQSYGAVGPVARGRGYWLARRGGAAVDGAGTSAVPDHTDVSGVRYAALVLQPGWNQIGDPFAFAVDWNARLEPSPDDIGDALFGFDGSYKQETVLQPYAGYWVENTSSSDQTLYLPYVEHAKSAPPVAAATPAAWTLQLALTAGGQRDDLLRVGVRQGSAAARDPGDWGTPPAPLSDHVRLVSLVEEGGAQQRLTGDWRGPGQDGWHFRLLASGTAGGVGQLELVDADRLPPGFALALYDPAGDRKYPWDGAAPFTLPRTLDAGGDEIVLLVGPAAWVEAQDGVPAVMPTAYELRQNYPNPFNPQTVISFDLPRPGRVRLEVFDARGRRVAVLRNEVLTGGVHKVPWDGTDARGARVASGVYLYRLQADGFAETRSMLLLK